jgi:uncharacterized membrane protein
METCGYIFMFSTIPRAHLFSILVPESFTFFAAHFALDFCWFSDDSFNVGKPSVEVNPWIWE